MTATARRPVAAPTARAKSPCAAPSSVIASAAAASCPTATSMPVPRRHRGHREQGDAEGERRHERSSRLSRRIRVRDVGVARSTSRVRSSSSPATSRAPLLIAYTTSMAGRTMLYSSTLRLTGSGGDALEVDEVPHGIRVVRQELLEVGDVLDGRPERGHRDHYDGQSRGSSPPARGAGHAGSWRTRCRAWSSLLVVLDEDAFEIGFATCSMPYGAAVRNSSSIVPSTTRWATRSTAMGSRTLPTRRRTSTGPAALNVRSMRRRAPSPASY